MPWLFTKRYSDRTVVLLIEEMKLESSHHFLRYASLKLPNPKQTYHKWCKPIPYGKFTWLWKITCFNILLVSACGVVLKKTLAFLADGLQQFRAPSSSNKNCFPVLAGFIAMDSYIPIFAGEIHEIFAGEIEIGAGETPVLAGSTSALLLLLVKSLFFPLPLDFPSRRTQCAHPRKEALPPARCFLAMGKSVEIHG